MHLLDLVGAVRAVGLPVALVDAVLGVHSGAPEVLNIVKSSNRSNGVCRLIAITISEGFIKIIRIKGLLLFEVLGVDSVAPEVIVIIIIIAIIAIIL